MHFIIIVVIFFSKTQQIVLCYLNLAREICLRQLPGTLHLLLAYSDLRMGL